MRAKYYVGYEGSKKVVFRSAEPPTVESCGYHSAIGPFRTKKAAEYMRDNDRCSTVAQAERAVKRKPKDEELTQYKDMLVGNYLKTNEHGICELLKITKRTFGTEEVSPLFRVRSLMRVKGEDFEAEVDICASRCSKLHESDYSEIMTQCLNVYKQKIEKLDHLLKTMKENTQVQKYDIDALDDWNMVLFACHHAYTITELNVHQREELYRLAYAWNDAYSGEKIGYIPPQGYDWSGIRDSSEKATAQMASQVRGYLKQKNLQKITVKKDTL